MSLFADASALIAIITQESDGEAWSDILGSERRRLCSSLSIWETVAGLCRSCQFSIPEARTHVNRFLDEASFDYVGIGKAELDIALFAYETYGTGRHAAALNMGDCYSYACTITNGAKLLFKGHDFSKTDIEPAVR